VTVKQLARLPLPPSGLVTVTLYAPAAAVLWTVTGTVILVDETEVGAPAEIPAPTTFTVRPETKFFPGIVTDVVLPRGADGVADAVGSGLGVTVKGAEAVLPSGLVTVRVRAPVAALAATVTLSAIVLALTKVLLTTVTPVPLIATAAPATNPVPVTSTGKFLAP